jgi:hypothetical protein
MCCRNTRTGGAGLASTSLIAFGSILVFAAGCAPAKERAMQFDRSARHAGIDFAAGPDGTRFVAAVRFRRSRVELVKAPGWEKQHNLGISPAITWWWYEVDMAPEAVLDGTWEAARAIMLKCRHYLATSSDTAWVGVIVRDEHGKELWLKDFALREGHVVDSLRNEVMGDEAEVMDVIRRYRLQNGLGP